ncbi:hypothetical protein TNCV_2795021 [Trichonephila clavipes]|nr:hypothetical protein TNCV_2795021 [Trichonephila clavipes]
MRDLAHTASQQKRLISETPARIAAERRSVEEAGEIGAKASSHIRLPRHIEDSSSMEKEKSSAEESSFERFQLSQRR